MSFWLQSCRSCGYVAANITEASGEVAAVVRSEAWQSRHAEDPYPQPTDIFRRAAFLAEKLEQIGRAAEYYLSAAWIVDEVGDPGKARALRSRSADLFIEALALHQIVDGTETRIRLVDVLRRAHRWTEAITLANEMLAGDQDPTTHAIVKFGREKAEARDDARYALDAVTLPA